MIDCSSIVLLVIMLIIFMLSALIHLTTLPFLTCDWTVVVDLSNTLRGKEFPQDACSRGVGGSGDTMLLLNVVGLLELQFSILVEYYHILN